MTLLQVRYLRKHDRRPAIGAIHEEGRLENVWDDEVYRRRVREEYNEQRTVTEVKVRPKKPPEWGLMATKKLL